jgi:GNAT superfamily N-acetyltransferase
MGTQPGSGIFERVLTTCGEYDLDDDPDRIDVDAAWEFLSTQAYWARWRTRHDLERQLASAWRVVGVYDRDSGHMVGFARAVSDGVAFAYLADLYVLPGVRGKGLGKALAETMIDLGPGADFRWTLHTMDAHRLYEQFGFAPPDPTYLERPARGAQVRRVDAALLRTQDTG